MRTFQLLTGLLLTLIVISCSPDSAQESKFKSSLNIAALIDRSEPIQHGNEWSKVQQSYADAVNQLQSDPSNLQARLALTDLYIQEARVTGEHGHYYPAALKQVDLVLKNPNANEDVQFQALTAKAGVLLSLHEFSDAMDVAMNAIKLNNHNAKIHGVLVDCFVELGQYDAAIQTADQMIALRPDIRSYSRVSYLREIHGDVEGAEEAMELAIKAGYPGLEETSWAMLTLAELKIRYGQLDQAESILNEILATRPNYPFATAGLAEIAYQRGDLETSEALLDEAIAAIPEVGFYIQLAQIRKDEGKTAEFEALIEEIKLMLQDDIEAGHNMNLEYAHLYLDLLEQPSQALKYANEEYTKRPKNIDVNRVMAAVYTALDQPAEASKYMTAASVTNSKHPDLLAMMHG